VAALPNFLNPEDYLEKAFPTLPVASSCKILKPSSKIHTQVQIGDVEAGYRVPGQYMLHEMRVKRWSLFASRIVLLLVPPQGSYKMEPIAGPFIRGLYYGAVLDVTLV
jgi:hypothetical protein